MAKKILAGATGSALKEALHNMGFAYRYNERSSNEEWCHVDEKVWTVEDDMHAAHMRGLVAKTYDFEDGDGNRKAAKFGASAWRESMHDMLHTSRVDPFLVWVNELPPWDNVRRLDYLLERLFIIDSTVPTDLLKWASAAPMLGAIERAMNPGAELHETVVLVGPRDIGKTTLYKSLLPHGEESWRRGLWQERFDPRAKDLDIAMKLMGSVFVEISEMRGMGLADISHIKAVMMAAKDDVRMPYARHKTEALRRCVFVASTNDSQPLPNDPDGNRQFVAIRIVGGDLTKVLDFAKRTDEHKQIWAEALSRVRHGGSGRLPMHLKEVQADENEGHRASVDSVEQVIVEVAEDLEVFVIGRLRAACLKRFDDIGERFVSESEIKRVLKQNGWMPPTHRTWVEGKQGRFWQRPQDRTE